MPLAVEAEAHALLMHVVPAGFAPEPINTCMSMQGDYGSIWQCEHVPRPIVIRPTLCRAILSRIAYIVDLVVVV